MGTSICLIEDDIVSIEELPQMCETIDITVSGDNLFVANDILTHNSGMSNSDVEMTDISESIGTAQTADLVIALINTEELEKLGQLMIKQLKNRYNDVTKNKKFLVGIDRSKMRIYDIGNVTIDGEYGILDNVPDYGKYDDWNDYSDVHKPSNKFSDFKFS